MNAREQAKLMTFPDNWELPAKSRDAVHAVGNSVPPAFSLKATELAIEALEEMAKADEEASKQEEDMEPEKMVDGKQILQLQAIDYTKMCRRTTIGLSTSSFTQ